MDEQIQSVLRQVEQVIRGKAPVVEKVMMAVLSGGHVLLDDVPGVGKTSLVVALSKALGLRYRRVQCTPDVLPSDIVGFSVYDRQSGSFRYMPGAVNDADLLLADEINRTSSKTQSALLEAMEERQVTVDGHVHPLSRCFMVFATENHVGAAGTQLLPQAQLDRFLVRLTLGYPDFDAQMDILRDRQTTDPMDTVAAVANREAVLDMQRRAAAVTIHEEILAYITRLAMASREDPWIELGLSPRGALALSRMARACACLRGRDYVIPQDVREIFTDVCGHRILLSPKARAARVDARTALEGVLARVEAPYEGQ